MKKFHVNPESGVVGICTATKRACPLGGSELHFDKEQNAHEFAEALMESKHAPEDTVRKGGRLVIIAGVPGSGKSTLANKIISETPDAIVVNRDDLRTQLFGEKYHQRNPDKKSESQVTAILQNRMLKKLREGGTVIDDNTNLNPRNLHSLVELAKNYGATVEIHTMETSLEEAKRRNQARGAAGGRLVPEHVIDRMAAKSYDENGVIKDILVGEKQVVFVEKETRGMRELAEFNKKLEEKYPILGKDVAIVDIDGTLSFNHEELDKHLGPGAINGKKDWLGFYRASENSPVNQSVLNVVKKLRESGITVFALTGRVDSFARSTITFLEKSDAPISRAIMGREGDFRGDYHVKTDAASAIEAQGFRIVHSIDDRPSSIRVWEERGISVSRVPAHLIGDVLEKYEMPAVDDLVGTGFCIVCAKEAEINIVIHETCRTKV